MRRYAAEAICVFIVDFALQETPAPTAPFRSYEREFRFAWNTRRNSWARRRDQTDKIKLINGKRCEDEPMRQPVQATLQHGLENHCEQKEAQVAVNGAASRGRLQRGLQDPMDKLGLPFGFRDRYEFVEEWMISGQPRAVIQERSNCD